MRQHALLWYMFTSACLLAHFPMQAALPPPLLKHATVKSIQSSNALEFSVVFDGTHNTSSRFEVVTYQRTSDFLRHCGTDVVLWPVSPVEQWARLGALPTQAQPAIEPHMRHTLALSSAMEAVNVNRISISMWVKLLIPEGVANTNTAAGSRPTLFSWTGGSTENVDYHTVQVYLVAPKYHRLGVHIVGASIDFTYEVDEDVSSMPILQQEGSSTSTYSYSNSNSWHLISISIASGGNSFIMVDGVSSIFNSPQFSIPRNGDVMLLQAHGATSTSTASLNPQNTFYGRMSRVTVIFGEALPVEKMMYPKTILSLQSNEDSYVNVISMLDFSPAGQGPWGPSLLPTSLEIGRTTCRHDAIENVDLITKGWTHDLVGVSGERTTMTTTDSNEVIDGCPWSCKFCYVSGDNGCMKDFLTLGDALLTTKDGCEAGSFEALTSTWCGDRTYTNVGTFVQQNSVQSGEEPTTMMYEIISCNEAAGGCSIGSGWTNNIALGKHTLQSVAAFGTMYGAELAVDGNIATCASTRGENSWWRVDFGTTRHVRYVSIKTTADEEYIRLDQFQIQVGNVDKHTSTLNRHCVDSRLTSNLDGTLLPNATHWKMNSREGDGDSTLDIVCSEDDVEGRYLFIQIQTINILYLCEVEVLETVRVLEGHVVETGLPGAPVVVLKLDDDEEISVTVGATEENIDYYEVGWDVDQYTFDENKTWSHRDEEFVTPQEITLNGLSAFNAEHVRLVVNVTMDNDAIGTTWLPIKIGDDNDAGYPNSFGGVGMFFNDATLAMTETQKSEAALMEISLEMGDGGTWRRRTFPFVEGMSDTFNININLKFIVDIQKSKSGREVEIFVMLPNGKSGVSLGKRVFDGVTGDIYKEGTTVGQFGKTRFEAKRFQGYLHELSILTRDAPATIRTILSAEMKQQLKKNTVDLSPFVIFNATKTPHWIEVSGCNTLGCGPKTTLRLGRPSPPTLSARIPNSTTMTLNLASTEYVGNQTVTYFQVNVHRLFDGTKEPYHPKVYKNLGRGNCYGDGNQTYLNYCLCDHEQIGTFTFDKCRRACDRWEDCQAFAFKSQYGSTVPSTLKCMLYPKNSDTPHQFCPGYCPTKHLDRTVGDVTNAGIGNDYGSYEDAWTSPGYCYKFTNRFEFAPIMEHGWPLFDQHFYQLQPAAAGPHSVTFPLDVIEKIKPDRQNHLVYAASCSEQGCGNSQQLEIAVPSAPLPYTIRVNVPDFIAITDLDLGIHDGGSPVTSIKITVMDASMDSSIKVITVSIADVTSDVFSINVPGAHRVPIYLKAKACSLLVCGNPTLSNPTTLPSAPIRVNILGTRTLELPSEPAHSVSINSGEKGEADGSGNITHFQVQIFPSDSTITTDNSCEQTYLSDVSSWSPVAYDSFRQCNITKSLSIHSCLVPLHTSIKFGACAAVKMCNMIGCGPVAFSEQSTHAPAPVEQVVMTVPCLTCSTARLMILPSLHDGNALPVFYTISILPNPPPMHEFNSFFANQISIEEQATTAWVGGFNEFTLSAVVTISNLQSSNPLFSTIGCDVGTQKFFIKEQSQSTAYDEVLTTSQILPSEFLLKASLTTGATATSGGIFMGGVTGGCGNLYLWIGASGKFFCGVQCNAGDSSTPLQGSTIAATHTDYTVECRYDGTTATLWLNGQKEASEVKTFNYEQTMERITIGRGSLLSNDWENYDFGYVFISFPPPLFVCSRYNN